jgi:hypothetical protein
MTKDDPAVALLSGELTVEERRLSRCSRENSRSRREEKAVALLSGELTVEERRLSRCSRENSRSGREGCRVALGRTHGRGVMAVIFTSCLSVI